MGKQKVILPAVYTLKTTEMHRKQTFNISKKKVTISKSWHPSQSQWRGYNSTQLNDQNMFILKYHTFKIDIVSLSWNQLCKFH